MQVIAYTTTCFKNYLFFSLFFTISLSQQARTAGNKNNINNVEHNVPSDIVLHIFDAIAEVKIAIIKVTIISIVLDVNIACIELLYEAIIDSFISLVFLCSR